MTMICRLFYRAAYKKRRRTVVSGLAGACCLAVAAIVSAESVSAPGARSPLGVQDPLVRPAYSQKNLQSQPVMAVALAGENLVSVGLRGLIMISEDQGETWEQVPSPVATDLVQVRFQDALKGWAVGQDSVLLATSDGGRSWQVRLDGRRLATLLKDYYSLSPDHMSKGDVEAMLAEIDFATANSADPNIIPTPFLDIEISESGEGFVVGAFGMILRTDDNGLTWQPWIERTENDRRMHLYSVAIHGGQVYLGGEQGLLLRLDRDAGRFVQIETPYTGTFFGVHVTKHLLMAYGLRGNLFVSRDQGANWEHVDTHQKGSLVDAVDDGPDHTLLVSQRGELIRLAHKTLEVTKLPVSLNGAVYSAVSPGAHEPLVVAGFSGIRTIAMP